MRDASDIELNRSEPPPPPPADRRSPVPWMAIAIALVAALGLGWYFFIDRGALAPASTEFTETSVPPTAAQPLGGDRDPSIDVPPLEQTDELVRRLVRELSSHPRAAAWLATNQLIRGFTVAVDNIAGGSVPSQALRALRPTGRFQVIETDTELRIDPRSYARYDGLADAVNSVDASGAAQLYTMLKPRIEEAYVELGTDVPFDRTLERAIVSLLRAPALEGNVPLDPKGGVFGFADQRVEGLTAAQRQLVRLGPRNVRLIQAKLRAIALALGIPATRLP